MILKYWAYLFIANTPKLRRRKWAIIQNCYLRRWLFTEPSNGRMTQIFLWLVYWNCLQIMFTRRIRKINLIMVPLGFWLLTVFISFVHHLIYLALNEFRLFQKPIHLQRIKIYSWLKLFLKLLQYHLDGWINPQGD